MKRTAFTLIELAIALTIIGIMIGGSFQAVKAMREKSKVAEAKEQIRAAKDTILGYVGKWPSLPTVDNFDANLSPIKNNQHVIFYVPADDLLADDICAYNTTTLSVVDNGAVPPRTTDNVAFVVVHEGANYNMQTARNANVVNIYAPSTRIDDNTTPVNIVEQYDDIVDLVTLDELQQNVDCSANKLVILNDYALPRDANSSANYLGTPIYADGGFPLSDGGDSDSEDDYEWCLESSSALTWLSNNTCNGAISIVSDCSSATFAQCTTPILSGLSSPAPGTYRLNIYVKDKIKTVRKSFTITIDSN